MSTGTRKPSTQHGESQEPQRAFTRRIDCGTRDSMDDAGERRDRPGRGRATTGRESEEGRHR